EYGASHTMPGEGWPLVESPRPTVSGRLRSIFSSLSAAKRRTHIGDVTNADAFYADDQTVPDRGDVSSQDTAAEGMQAADARIGGQIERGAAIHASGPISA
ncbi:hypothetical protein EC988_006204, partial [Linderina pennispora]